MGKGSLVYIGLILLLVGDPNSVLLLSPFDYSYICFSWALLLTFHSKVRIPL